ncbi:arginine--tRNA ligase [Candidatus Pacearchaeota archaeon]|nr:arginine--tRNA ligase [Candidatus Pacearchaeota archaeon]
MKDVVIQFLVKQTKLSAERLDQVLEVPKDPTLGAYAFPCFSLAKEQKKAPHVIAQELAQTKKLPPGILKLQAVGPYLNIFIDMLTTAHETLATILKQKEKYGQGKAAQKETILIECSSPNIAKPFGIGHLRSTIIGSSLARIASGQGAKVKTLNYLGDWGTQFGKLIVGYERWGDTKKLKADPITHLLDLYVKVSADPTLEDAARAAFAKLEQGDKKYLAFWKQFKELSLVEFTEIYAQLGVTFDVYSGESLYNTQKDAVLTELKTKKLLKKDQGAEIVDLELYGLGVALIQKSDGTTLYATRDIAAAQDRQKKYKFTQMWYEVGAEQKLHFRQLFKLLELLGNTWAQGLTHIDHGLYLGEDGKKFATRKGKTVFMKDIVEEAQELATHEVMKREKLSKKEVATRAQAIARAAIIYGDLKNNRTHDMVFDLDRFLAFEGDTGPYLLYAYARARSVLTKAQYKPGKSLKLTKLTASEKALITKLAQFPEACQQAYDQRTPHVIAGYAFQLAQAFNEFYHAEQIIGSTAQASRCTLVQAYTQTLKNALLLLGIEPLEAM